MPDTKRFLRETTGALAVWWALAAMAMGAHAQAPSPAAAQPDTTTASYGDWVLQCQREGVQAAGPFCELRQTVLAEGQRPVAQLAIARLSAQAPLKLAVVLPTHVSFAEGPRLAVGEAGPAGTAGAAAEAAISLTWRRCLPMGCFADGDLGEAVTRQWRAQTPLPVTAPTTAPTAAQAQTQPQAPTGRLASCSRTAAAARSRCRCRCAGWAKLRRRSG